MVPLRQLVIVVTVLAFFRLAAPLLLLRGPMPHQWAPEPHPTAGQLWVAEWGQIGHERK